MRSCTAFGEVMVRAYGPLDPDLACLVVVPSDGPSGRRHRWSLDRGRPACSLVIMGGPSGPAAWDGHPRCLSIRWDVADRPSRRQQASGRPPRGDPGSPVAGAGVVPPRPRPHRREAPTPPTTPPRRSATGPWRPANLSPSRRFLRVAGEMTRSGRPIPTGLEHSGRASSSGEGGGRRGRRRLRDVGARSPGDGANAVLITATFSPATPTGWTSVGARASPPGLVGRPGRARVVVDTDRWFVVCPTCSRPPGSNEPSSAAPDRPAPRPWFPVVTIHMVRPGHAGRPPGPGGGERSGGSMGGMRRSSGRPCSRSESRLVLGLRPRPRRRPSRSRVTSGAGRSPRTPGSGWRLLRRRAAMDRTEGLPWCGCAPRSPTAATEVFTDRFPIAPPRSDGVHPGSDSTSRATSTTTAPQAGSTPTASD